MGIRKTIWRYITNGFNCFNENGTEMIEITNATNLTNIKGGILGGDGTNIYANQTNAQPRIYCAGGGWIALITRDVANGIIDYYKGETEHMMRMSEGTNSLKIQTNMTNYDIELTPDGTGKLKYGTKNATGDVACDGNVEIKDSAGNTVKLMTCA